MTCTRPFALAWTLAAAVDGIADAKPVTRYGAMVTKAVRGETRAFPGTSFSRLWGMSPRP